MKRSFGAMSAAMVCLLLATSAFAIWPDPCDYDPSALVGQGKPFNWNDGIYRVPVSIANMGYWDENAVWHWWTETIGQSNSIPSCFPKAFDDRAANLFYDPNTECGTAVLPKCQDGNCSESMRYNYHWPVYHDPPMPETGVFTPQKGYTVSNFEFRYKHYEDGSSTLSVVFRAGFNVMVPQLWWEPSICILNPSACPPPPPSTPPLPPLTFDDNEAWGIVGNYANPDQSIVFYADPTLSYQLTLDDIEYAKVEEEVNGAWNVVVTQGTISKDVDNTYEFMMMNYDATRSWWSPYNLSNLSIATDSLMKIAGWEPQAGKKYRLVLKIKNGPEIVSNPYTCPNYFYFGFIPSKSLKTVATPKGKEISITQQLIKFTEQSGNLIIQYLEPNLLTLYDSGITLQPGAPTITGSHVRVGLYVLDTPERTKGVMIRGPAHLGTVVVPKDVVDWLKSQPEYKGTIDVVIHQRDNYLSGFNRYYTDTVTYTFAP